MLNPDTEVEKGAVVELVRELQAHPRCGAAGSQLLSTDGSAAASAFPFPSKGHEFVNASLSERMGRMFGVGARSLQPETSSEVGWVTGASVMFRSTALRETGLFDDGFFLYFEEVELMRRLHAHGWTVRHVPESRVMHIEGASTGLAERGCIPLAARLLVSIAAALLCPDRRRLIGDCCQFGAARRPCRRKDQKPFSAKARPATELAEETYCASASGLGLETPRPSIPASGAIEPGKQPAWMSNR